MSTLRVELYGGEDYRLYDGTRLVATVYAEQDLARPRAANAKEARDE